MNRRGLYPNIKDQITKRLKFDTMNLQENYKLISTKLSQCLTCNQFIKGTITNFKRHHESKHSTKRTVYNCNICEKSYARKHYLQQHLMKIHNHSMNETTMTTKTIQKKISIEPIKPWTPPFEASTKPRFRLIPPQKPWATLTKPIKKRSTMTILKKMIIPDPISPPTSPKLKTDKDTSNDIFPTASASTETITQDEYEHKQNMTVFIYSIYGIFNNN